MSESLSLRFDVIGLFPEIVEACCGYGVIGRAVQRGAISLVTRQLRDYTGGSHHPIDDDPYGGGPGHGDAARADLRRDRARPTRSWRQRAQDLEDPHHAPRSAFRPADSREISSRAVRSSHQF